MSANYLIISHPRSGSNYLFDCLSHVSPGANYNEPFSSTDDFNIIINKGKLIKTHLRDFLNIPDLRLQKKLLSTRQTVLLLRKNIFEAAMSDLIASHFKQWNSYTYNTDNSFMVDKKIMLNYVDGYIGYWKQFVEFKKNNHVDKVIYYEDLSFNTKTDLKQIFDIDKRYLVTVNVEKKAPSKNLIIKNYSGLNLKYLKYIKNVQIDGTNNKNGNFTLVC